MKKALLTANAVLILMCCALAYSVQSERSEKERFKTNQASLLSQVEYWATEHGKSAADALKLSLTVNELRNANSQLVKTADELNIKLRRMQSASTTGTKTEVKVVTQVRDSVVYRDSVIVPVKAFTWQDSWTDITGVLERDSVDLDIISRDTLTTVVHKVPHKFWFIKWGCKAIKQTVVSSNPHTKITYNEYIELK
jgi:hypothetical protein